MTVLAPFKVDILQEMEQHIFLMEMESIVDFPVLRHMQTISSVIVTNQNLGY